MSRRHELMNIAVNAKLSIVGIMIPIFGIVCLLPGLAGLVVGLPLSKGTDAEEVRAVLAFAGIVSLMWTGMQSGGKFTLRCMLA